MHGPSRSEGRPTMGMARRSRALTSRASDTPSLHLDTLPQVQASQCTRIAPPSPSLRHTCSTPPWPAVCPPSLPTTSPRRRAKPPAPNGVGGGATSQHPAVAFARYLIASDEVVRKGHGENNKLNRPVSVTRRYIFDQQSAGRMQQYSLPKFFEIVMTEDDIIGTSTDYLRCSYHDCYGTTNQTSLVDPESRAVDMAAVAHLIAVTRPRTRLDAYPMLLLAKDLISHMLRDDIEVNKQLEAKLSAQVSELALVNKGRAELESSIAELRQSSASRITELEQQIAEVEKSRDSISLLLADVKNEANRSRKTTNPGTSTARRVKFEPSIPKSNEDSAAILEQMADTRTAHRSRSKTGKRAAKTKRVRRRRDGRRGSFDSELTGKSGASSFISVGGMSSLSEYDKNDVDECSSAAGSTLTASVANASSQRDRAHQSFAGVVENHALMAQGAYQSSLEQIRSMKYYDEMTVQQLFEILQAVFATLTVGVWNFDTLHLIEAAQGKPLCCMTYGLLASEGVIADLELQDTKLKNFLFVIEQGYRALPYHSSAHAADVVQALYCLLKMDEFQAHIDQEHKHIELLACIIAACIHDFKHPGRSNAFEVNSESDVALLYNDHAVLENMHLAESFEVMRQPECNFIDNFERNQWKDFRKLVVDLVLATDLGSHFKFFGEFKSRFLGGEAPADTNVYGSESHTMLRQCLLKTADISHAAKDTSLHVKWSERIQEEFFVQGDEEKLLGIEIGMVNDRDTLVMPKSQCGFLQFLVFPLYKGLSLVMDTPGPWTAQLDANLAYWKREQESPSKDWVEWAQVVGLQ